MEKLRWKKDQQNHLKQIQAWRIGAVALVSQSYRTLGSVLVWTPKKHLGMTGGFWKTRVDAITTVDGSEIPNNHLGCTKPSKLWDILHINWWTPDSFHQQYHYWLSYPSWWWPVHGDESQIQIRCKNPIFKQKKGWTNPKQVAVLSTTLSTRYNRYNDIIMWYESMSILYIPSLDIHYPP